MHELSPLPGSKMEECSNKYHSFRSSNSSSPKERCKETLDDIRTCRYPELVRACGVDETARILRLTPVNMHMDYSIEQKVWSVIWYSKHGKPKPVQIECRRKFGRHDRTPDGATIKRWWTKIFETGSANKRKKTKTRWVRTELTETYVIGKFQEDEHASQRSVTRMDG
uniref:DUF4817 domain-containing protein n=1 Tax=Ditylenchus dipsaci TaxID=166011 RepID=A0A915DDM7_9BILA